MVSGSCARPREHGSGVSGAVAGSMLSQITGIRLKASRGEGFFYGIELVKDKATKETFDDEESERLLRGFLTPALWEAGLYCRADDRGDPVVQLAPPLISGQAEFDAIYDILRTVLTEASARM